MINNSKPYGHGDNRQVYAIAKPCALRLIFLYINGKNKESCAVPMNATPIINQVKNMKTICTGNVAWLFFESKVLYYPMR